MMIDGAGHNSIQPNTQRIDYLDQEKVNSEFQIPNNRRKSVPI